MKSMSSHIFLYMTFPCALISLSGGLTLDLCFLSTCGTLRCFTDSQQPLDDGSSIREICSCGGHYPDHL
jgi:hypothetical protein